MELIDQECIPHLLDGLMCIIGIRSSLAYKSAQIEEDFDIAQQGFHVPVVKFVLGHGRESPVVKLEVEFSFPRHQLLGCCFGFFKEFMTG